MILLLVKQQTALRPARQPDSQTAGPLSPGVRSLLVEVAYLRRGSRRGGSIQCSRRAEGEGAEGLPGFTK